MEAPAWWSCPFRNHAFSQVHPSKGELTSRAIWTRCSVALKPKMMLNSEPVPVPLTLMLYSEEESPSRMQPGKTDIPLRNPPHLLAIQHTLSTCHTPGTVQADIGQRPFPAGIPTGQEQGGRQKQGTTRSRHLSLPLYVDKEGGPKGSHVCSQTLPTPSTDLRVLASQGKRDNEVLSRAQGVQEATPRGGKSCRLSLPHPWQWQMSLIHNSMLS